MDKLIILAILILFFGLLFIVFILLGRKKAKETFLKASRLEDSGKPEDACYIYAIAARQGASSKDCRHKIVSLWSKHGPFNFVGSLEKSLTEFHGQGEGHSEGYHETIVAYINKAVSSHK